MALVPGDQSRGVEDLIPVSPAVSPHYFSTIEESTQLAFTFDGARFRPGKIGGNSHFGNEVKVAGGSGSLEDLFSLPPMEVAAPKGGRGKEEVSVAGGSDPIIVGEELLAINSESPETGLEINSADELYFSGISEFRKPSECRGPVPASTGKGCTINHPESSIAGGCIYGPGEVCSGDIWGCRGTLLNRLSSSALIGEGSDFYVPESPGTGTLVLASFSIP